MRVILKTRCGCWRYDDANVGSWFPEVVRVPLMPDVSLRDFRATDAAAKSVFISSRIFRFRDYDDHGTPIFYEEL